MKKFVKTSHLILISILIVAPISCIKRESTCGKEIALRLEPGPENPRNSEGDFIRLADGRILFVYTHFTGGSGDHATAYLAGRISDDDGRTWADEDVLILPNEGNMNIMSVSLLRLADNKIALFYLLKNSESDCIPIMRISTDEAHSWSEPNKCINTTGYYVLNNDRAVQLKSGRIILPVALHNTPETEWSPMGRIMCYFSDDGGNTWLKSKQVPNPEHIILQEPGIIELTTGELMMFCRTDMGVQYLSYSMDKGERWSAVEASRINSPQSPASIERIPSTGNLLMVWNDNFEIGGGKRTPFNLAVSKDEGKTWTNLKYIESDPDGWYCYTAIEFVNDHILLAHCAGDRKIFNGLETTQITRLNLEWINKETTPNPFVSSDSAGLVKLKCTADQAEIYYTLDGSNPTRSSILYEQPFCVPRTTSLQIRAWESEKTPSKIIQTSVGIDVFQKAQEFKSELARGLRFSFYEGQCKRVSDMDKLVPVASGTMSDISIEDQKMHENFAYKFEGYIDIPKDNIYTFYLLSNDGSVMYMHDVEFIKNDGPHGAREVSSAMALRKGKHKFALKYFQMGGEKLLRVFWEGPDWDKREIPASALFHVGES